MSKRLIDANALIAEYDRVHIGPPGGARKLMEDAPTVDAVEVVHGRWVQIYTIDDAWMGTQHIAGYKCNHCGKNSSVKVKYCPNCGAKMDGDWNES